MVDRLSTETFNSVLKNHDLAIVDFWAEWCAPCKAIAPVLEEFEKKVNGKLKIFKLNVDANPLIASEYGVESIPTLLVFKKGKPIDSLVVGMTSKRELEKKLFSVIH